MPVTVAPAAATAPTGAAAPVAAPVAEVKPADATPVSKDGVEVATLSGVDPQSVGLLGAKESLGATLWKGTPLSLVENLMPALLLPTSSPDLNSLAARLFLTAAPPPEGPASGNENMLMMRVEKLLALGDAKGAWKLANAAKADIIDDITLRHAAEAALLTSEHDDICAKIPDIIKVHTDPEWQKLFLICQLATKDYKAAQVTLDLLHTQNIKDDLFFFVIEKNLIAGGKQLPRQLTPMQPLVLAALLLTDLPLPPEIYMHPSAVLIPQLIRAKAREDNVRLALAEHAAERGVIKPAELAAVYRSVGFTLDVLANANNSPETGPRLRALLYQAALEDRVAPDAKDPMAAPLRRIADAIHFMHASDAPLLGAAGGALLAEMLDGIEPSDDYNAMSGAVAHIYVLANKPDRALAWIKQAKHAQTGMPGVGAELQSIWPLIVLGGFESDSDYAANLDKWMNAMVPLPDPKADPKAMAPDLHVQREQMASVLMLLDAAGFAVPETAWSRAINPPVFDKHQVPPALLYERMRMASTAGRRGETILFALSLASVPMPGSSGGGNGNGVSSSGWTSDTLFLTMVETVRALRLVGLTSDAALLAREAALVVLTPTVAK